MIRKAEYRQRAHCNPLSNTKINYPLNHIYVNWNYHFPNYNKDEITEIAYLNNRLNYNTEEEPIIYDQIFPDSLNGKEKPIDYLDIGCGFGNFILELAKKHNDKLILGFEIRNKVATYACEKIRILREESNNLLFNNCSVIRTNAMKYITNYICKNSVERIFILFPDPHFKKSNWRRRILTPAFLSLYAYLLKVNGRIYFISDVKETYDAMKNYCDQHPLFFEVPLAELENDIDYELIYSSSNEGKKCYNMNKKIYRSVYELKNKD